MSQPPQQQNPPGHTDEMDPRPDHGENSYRGSGRLTGKAAIITGADSGIGRAVAIAFAREGADVVISYLDEDDDARETAKWVEDAGRRAVVLPGDLTDPAHCRRIVDRTVEEFGRVDVLVANAAFQMTYESIEEIPDDDWALGSRATSSPQPTTTGTAPSPRTSARSSTWPRRPSRTCRRAPRSSARRRSTRTPPTRRSCPTP